MLWREWFEAQALSFETMVRVSAAPAASGYKALLGRCINTNRHSCLLYWHKW